MNGRFFLNTGQNSFDQHLAQFLHLFPVVAFTHLPLFFDLVMLQKTKLALHPEVSMMGEVLSVFVTFPNGRSFKVYPNGTLEELQGENEPWAALKSQRNQRRFNF